MLATEAGLLDNHDMHSHWHKQDGNPLFPDLLWSRPENKLHAGKLLIIGGTGQSFAAPAEAYAAAKKAGAGSIRVLLPDSLKRTVGKLFPVAEFAPSTPSGSFGMSSLAEFLDAASWSDGVTITSDTGNNSETAQLLESFYGKYHGRLSVNGDCLSVLTQQTATLLANRPETALVMSFTELQRFATQTKFTTAFTSGMGLAKLVETLHDFNKLHAAHLIVLYEKTVVVAVNGQVSTTRYSDTSASQLSAAITTWWMQSPAKPFEAMTTGVYQIGQDTPTV